MQRAVRADGGRRRTALGAQNARDESPMNAGGAADLRAPARACLPPRSRMLDLREIRVADGDRAINHPHRNLRPPRGQLHQFGKLDQVKRGHDLSPQFLIGLLQSQRQIVDAAFQWSLLDLCEISLF